MDLSTYIPKYIAQTEAQLPKFIITSDKWNELWNLSIVQGDYTAEAVDQIITEFQTAQGDIVDNDALAVHLAGIETVTGVKTFEASPVVPTPTSNYQAATKKYADDGLALKANITSVYSKTNMQTSGQAQLHWDNLIAKPNLADASWKPSVATVAALPVTLNTIGDQRVVLNDGDGKQAIYACIATTGTIDQQWDKIGDVDWMSAEATREAAEVLRISNENTRIINEGNAGSGRVRAEADRVKAEGLRATAETARQAHITNYSNPHSVSAAQVGAVSIASGTAMNNRIAALEYVGIVLVTATKTLAITDVNKIQDCNSESAITLNIPHHNSMPFPVGTVIPIHREGTGTVTITPLSNVTLHSPGEKRAIKDRYGEATLWQIAENDWRLVGSLE